ncbi:MAG: LamG domain-containing protein [Candidatus Micrarchaeota archaeon]|nr:LamG domain-containing protein [Candidatus Micrarchaeota archaeon]
MLKFQSAMEYLMTYGWAILAIAIVMVSLYSLGIFNTGNLQPTATPGSCQVVRTVAQTSLAGQCGNIIPKYTANYNKYNSNINVGVPMAYGGNFTYSVWVRYAGNSTLSQWPYLVGASASRDSHYYSAIRTNNWGALVYVEFGKYPTCDGSLFAATGSVSITDKRWHQALATYNGSTVTLYIDGVKRSSTLQSGMCSNSTNPYYIGRGFNGLVANAQIYNVSLDNSSVKALYMEGIGGAPIDVQHVVGWWPLNGNANDYSGSNRQGTPFNVTWNANWQSGYTTPSS